ncbi:MAG: hypothetical protein AAGB93_13520 [Planctomycetota bacterium]
MRPTLPDPARALLCVPTPQERERLERLAPDVMDADRWLAVETIGFGPIAAAARVAGLLAAHAPERVVLVGVAGGDPELLPVGTATAFGEVVLDGVGAGESFAALLPSGMGLPQWHGDDREAVEERLALADEGPRLLTVCSASEGTTMIEARRARFPDVAAEDMEGFGVALAAHFGRVPAHVVRGISNAVGDRDHARWRVDDGLRAAAELLRAALEGGDGR